MLAARLSFTLMVMVFVTSGSAIASDKNGEVFPFEEADTNNDGHLTKKEVKEAQLKLKESPEAKALLKQMTEEQLKKIEHDMVHKFFAKADLDKDGKITKKESDALNQKAGKKVEKNGKGN